MNSNEDQLVQIILVERDKGTHEQVIEAAAIASARSYILNANDPIWQEWLSGRFVKSVRRAKASVMDSLEELCIANVGVEDAVAMAFAPMKYGDLPSKIKKCQVQGTDYPKTGIWPYWEFDGPAVFINKDLDMSTGKTAAQVSHALMLYFMQATEDERETWLLSGCPVTLNEISAAKFDKLKNEDGVIAIRDAGFTEVDPGTITVIAFGE